MEKICVCILSRKCPVNSVLQGVPMAKYRGIVLSAPDGDLIYASMESRKFIVFNVTAECSVLAAKS